MYLEHSGQPAGHGMEPDMIEHLNHQTIDLAPSMYRRNEIATAHKRISWSGLSLTTTLLGKSPPQVNKCLHSISTFGTFFMVTRKLLCSWGKERHYISSHYCAHLTRFFDNKVTNVVRLLGTLYHNVESESSTWCQIHIYKFKASDWG